MHAGKSVWILIPSPTCLPLPELLSCPMLPWTAPALQADLVAALRKLLDAEGVQEVAELLPDPGPTKPHPRTARVNTLKLGVEEALQWLRQPPPEHRGKWAAVVSSRRCINVLQLCAPRPCPLDPTSADQRVGVV